MTRGKGGKKVKKANPLRPQGEKMLLTMAELELEIHRIGEQMRQDIAVSSAARRKQQEKAAASPKKPDEVSNAAAAVAVPTPRSRVKGGGGAGGETKVELEVKKEDSDPECDKRKETPATSVSPQKDLSRAMIVSVDATPTRVGGLLRLPGKERRIIYFYSIDWTSLVTFPGEASVQMEMINAGLALKLFEPYVKPFLDSYDKLIVKTDSHFYQSFKGFKTSDDLLFLEKLLGKVKSLQGNFEHAMKQTHDPDIINADYLSRIDKFPLEDFNLKASYSEKYVLVNLSEAALNYALKVLMLEVPRKYHANI